MTRVLVYPSLDSLEAVEGICDLTAKTDQTAWMLVTRPFVGFVVHWLIHKYIYDLVFYFKHYLSHTEMMRGWLCAMTCHTREKRHL